MLTPEQRLEIYEKMLPYFNGEERMEDYQGIKNVGFCWVLQDLKVDMYSLPELISKYPRSGKSLWFDAVFYGVDHKRTEVLNQCITEVKQLINDTIPS